MKPEILSSETIFKGKVFEVRVDKIREGDGEHKRDVVVHKGSVAILPVFDDGTVGLARQYRHAAGKELLETAAGVLEEGEDPEEGAARELEEEIGVKAGKIEKLTEFYASPGFLTEKMFLYLATDLTDVGQDLDDGENVTVERYSFPALYEMIRSGEIEDAKLIIGIMLAGSRLGYVYTS